MKKQTLLAAALLLLCSCTQRSCQQFERETQTSSRDYTVQMYSGGKIVFEDHFHGVINQEKGDGVFYFKGDTLVEVAGDYVIKSEK